VNGHTDLSSSIISPIPHDIEVKHVSSNRLSRGTFATVPSFDDTPVASVRTALCPRAAS